MTLIETHRQYMQRDKSNDDPSTDDEACCCEECGCEGNLHCGHDAIGKEMCSLGESMICGCCCAVWDDDKRKGEK